MNNMQAKRTMAVLVFANLTASILVCGCSTHLKAHRSCQDAAPPLAKVAVIDLTDGTEYQPILSGKPQTCGMRSGRVYLKPGETCGRHSTKAHEEMLVFLSGKGTAIIGDQQPKEYEIGQGKVSYIPPHTVHNMKNTGTEPLVYIYCVVPVNSGPENHGNQQEYRH